MLKRAEFRGAMLALGLVVLGLLGLIWYLPGLPGELLLQTLRFHILGLGAIFAIGAMIAGARLRGTLLLFIMIAGAVHSVTYVRDYLGRRPPIYEAPKAEFSLLSFNVLFDNPTPSKLVDGILANPPDVALILESPGISHQFDRLKRALPYSVGCEEGKACDISLHSAWPMANARVQRLPPFSRDRLVSAELTLNGETVTIVGVHLSKPYFDGASWVELQAVGEFLKTIEGPVVMAGDFNTAPWSDPLATLAANQSLAIGGWPSATWPVNLGLLGVPIDNVFSRGNARIKTLEAGDPLGSNHLPLRAVISLYASP